MTSFVVSQQRPHRSKRSRLKQVPGVHANCWRYYSPDIPVVAVSVLLWFSIFLDDPITVVVASSSMLYPSNTESAIINVLTTLLLHHFMYHNKVPTKSTW